MMKKKLFLFFVSLQLFSCILALSQSVAESSFPKIVFKDPYSADINMTEESISYYFRQIDSLGANYIIGVCDSLSTKYAKGNGISIIADNFYGGDSSQVKVTDRDPYTIERLPRYGFYLDLEAENSDTLIGYGFYHDPDVSDGFEGGRESLVSDHDSGLVFAGPIEGSVYNFLPLAVKSDTCRADYIMKIADKSGPSSAVVARLIVTHVDFPDSTWERLVKVSDFDSTGVYDTLSISFTQIGKDTLGYHPFHYELFWTDVKDLWVDKVIVSNNPGRVLFSLTEDSVETPLENYYSTLDTQLHRWYLLDEPTGGSLPAMRRVNILIGSVQPGTWDSSDTTSIFTTLTKDGAKGVMGDLYVNDVKGKEFNIDYYPYDHTHTAHRQKELNGFCAAMDTCSKKASNFEKPFYATIQVNAWDKTPGEIDSLTLRNPTPAEIKAEAYLALAYGAKGLAYYWYTTSYYNPNDTADWKGLGLVVWSPDSEEWVPNEKWYAVQEIDQVIDKIGPILTDADLTWLGACRSDTVGEPGFSFIDSLKSTEYTQSDTPYVEVGFFKDTVTNTDYFMLVNRRCLAEESQNVISYISKSGAHLIIDLCEHDTTLAGPLGSPPTIPFTTHLDPGEGKLFKIVPE